MYFYMCCFICKKVFQIQSVSFEIQVRSALRSTARRTRFTNEHAYVHMFRKRGGDTHICMLKRCSGYGPAGYGLNFIRLILGWDYLSSAACLMRPRLFYAWFVLQESPYVATLLATFEEHLR